MKKIFTILITTILISGTVTGCKKERIDLTEKTKITEEKIINGIKFSDIKMTKEEENYILVVTLINTTNEDLAYNTAEFTLKDKNNKKIFILEGYLTDGVITAGESKTLSTATSINLSKTYSVDYNLTNKEIETKDYIELTNPEPNYNILNEEKSVQEGASN